MCLKSEIGRRGEPGAVELSSGKGHAEESKRERRKEGGNWAGLGGVPLS